MSENYKDLGNISAVEPVYAIALQCDVCRVKWIGCWDQAACPQCGNHDSWEARGYYGKKSACTDPVDAA